MDLARPVEDLVAAVARSRSLSAATILAFTALCLLPGFATTPMLDGAEPGFVVAARGMWATGDYATIRLQTGSSDLIWAARGGYWLAAVASQLAGPDAPLLAYRLPSLLAGLLIPVLTWWAALGVVRNRGALLAGLFMAVSGALGLQARLAMPDTVLLAVLIIGAGALVRLWANPLAKKRANLAVLFWFAVGAGFLVRGPWAPGALVLTAGLLALERRGWIGQLKSVPGAVLMGTALALWAAVSGVTLLSGGFSYQPDLILARLGVPFAAEAPPGTYFLLLPLLIGPAVTFILVALPWVLDNLRRPAVVFALAWAGPPWLVAEFWPSKLPHLILPALPALAILGGVAIDRGGARIGGWISWFYSLGPLVWPPVIAVVFPVAFWALEGRVPVLGTIWLMAAAVAGPVAWFWLRQGRVGASATLAVISAMLIYWSFFGAFLPGLGGLRISERLEATAIQAVNCSPPNFSVAGYPEESPVFVIGPSVRFVDAAGAADFLAVDGCRVAAVERGQISSFRQRADDLGLDLADHARVVGLNLRKLRRAEMHVFTLDGISR